MRNDFESNYLIHHGILGQKWGIRNYQNPDGSLTEAGRKRYGVGPGRGVDDINTEAGIKKRTKDLKKAVAINNKKRGKEYSKIANNPENFLGLNKKHGKKIEEYSEQIKKGEEELKRLKDKLKTAKVTPKWDESKYKELVSKGYSEADSTIIADHKQIAATVAKDMISDLKRWQKEDGIPIAESLSKKSDSEIQKILSSKIAENIKNYDADSIFDFGNGVVNFGIDGLSEYSDNQPLTIEYDLKNKKVKNFYYT